MIHHGMKGHVILRRGMSHFGLLQQIHSPVLNPASCDRRGTFVMFAGVFASVTFLRAS